MIFKCRIKHISSVNEVNIENKIYKTICSIIPIRIRSKFIRLKLYKSNNGTRIILFDEPLASLDCKNARIFKEQIRKLHEQKPISGFLYNKCRNMLIRKAICDIITTITNEYKE